MLNFIVKEKVRLKENISPYLSSRGYDKGTIGYITSATSKETLDEECPNVKHCNQYTFSHVINYNSDGSINTNFDAGVSEEQLEKIPMKIFGYSECCDNEYGISCGVVIAENEEEAIIILATSNYRIELDNENIEKVKKNCNIKEIPFVQGIHFIGEYFD